MESDNNSISEEIIKESDVNKEEKDEEKQEEKDEEKQEEKPEKQVEEIENKFSFKSFYEKKKVTVIEYIVYTVISLGLTCFLTIKLGYTIYTFVRDNYNFDLDGITQEHAFFGGYRDSSEFVWKSFRNNLLIYSIFATIMVIVNKIVKRFLNLKIVKIFYLLFGVGFSCYLHRILFLVLFLVLVIEYILCLCYRYLGKILFIILTWLICIATEVCLEFHYIRVYEFLYSWPEYIINQYVGLDVVFQFILLKIISFNMEYSTMYENDTSKMEKLNAEKEKHFQECKDCQEGYFCLTTLKKYIILKQSDFSFVNLLIYTLYPAFYVAGPTIMYHTFIFQLQNKENKHNNIFFKKKVIFIIKCLVIFIAFEIFNHFVYITALLNDKKWRNKEALKKFKEDNPHYIYFFLVFNRLVFVFMKYDVIWKISRLWGWMDGICCEENINRCIYNNYSFEGFWRQWHRSFNIWLIRYMYIPMGGSDKKFINTFIIFSFVALWHEVKLHLLVWAWSIYLTLIPEMLIKRYFNKKERQYLTNYFWFRYLRAFVCSIDILLMICSNLCGYGFEANEIVDSFKEIFQMAGVLGVLGFLGFFALNTFPMFFVRDLEEANGIKKNY